MSFHPRSALSSATLTFTKQRGEEGSPIARFTPSDSFRSVVVHGDKLHFRFAADSDGSVPAWGYRFDVSPMRGLQVRCQRLFCSLQLHCDCVCVTVGASVDVDAAYRQNMPLVLVLFGR